MEEADLFSILCQKLTAERKKKEKKRDGKKKLLTLGELDISFAEFAFNVFSNFIFVRPHFNLIICSGKTSLPCVP